MPTPHLRARISLTETGVQAQNKRSTRENGPCEAGTPPSRRLLMFNRSRGHEKHGVEPGQALRMWLPAGCAVVLAAAAFWTVLRGDVNFLVDDPPAHWIVYPSVPNLGDEPDGPRRTVFSRRFHVAHPAIDARLTVRALKEYALSLNGVVISKSASGQDRSWKTPIETTISKDALTSGENELIATVTCRRGPPALWLALDLGSERIVSDGEWQASLLDAEPHPARLAASIPEFGPGSAPAEGERPPESFVRRWPTLLACGLVAAL